MFHPAASIEYTVRQRLRARVHVETHPMVTDHLILTFTAGDAKVEIMMSGEDVAELVDQVSGWLDRDLDMIHTPQVAS